MRKRLQVLVFLATAAAVSGAGPLAVLGATAARGAAGPAGGVRAAGSWGRAIEVPGLGALNKGGNAGITSVSCASAINCGAGGGYQDQRGHGQGFVVSQVGGRWGLAIEVPGLGALNTGGSAKVLSVSCALASGCAAGGDYKDKYRRTHGFVVSRVHGRWGRAIEVPGPGALNEGGNAYLYQVSCGSAGNCAAGGSYRTRSGHWQAFVASEENGRWRTAMQVPGIATLDAGHHAEVLSVSCAPASDCAAGGEYTDGGGRRQGFVVSEQNGVWGQAIEVPGLGALNAGSGPFGYGAAVSSVSCASAGNCAAGGHYTDGGSNQQGFAADERNGVWGQAIEVPGLGALNSNGGAGVGSLSCASAGNCLAGGDYNYDYNWGFVAVERNGVWGQAINAPGLGRLAGGRYADVYSVSCASAGNCAVGGDYEDQPGVGPRQGFVVSERNGRWGLAITASGPGTLKGLYAAAVSVSCGSPGNCTAGGYYADARGHQQGFVT